jgi:hypothetical protein
MTDSGSFIKVPTDDDLKRMTDATNDSIRRREQDRREREQRANEALMEAAARASISRRKNQNQNQN